jgi:hypothetical protein
VWAASFSQKLTVMSPRRLSLSRSKTIPKRGYHHPEWTSHFVVTTQTAALPSCTV